MKPVPGGHGDSRSHRLLFGWALLLLFALTFSVATARLFRHVPLEPRPAAGALVAALLAFAWREKGRIEAAVTARRRHDLLEALLDARLKVVSGLLHGPDPLKSGLPLDDAMRVLLQAAIDAVAARSGTIDFFEQKGQDLAVVQTISTGARAEDNGQALATVEIPLAVEEHLIGLLTLHLPNASDGLDREALHALERFAGRTAALLDRARAVGREQASAAYLEASNLVKSRFLTTISHELRTPLTSIIGYSKTLDNHWDRLEPEQKRDFVREIEKQGGRLCRLIERILEAARVELQGVQIEPVQHDVRTSVQKALAPFMATDGHRIKLGLPELPVEAEVDPFVVDQVLSNLVDNALRYTKGDVRVSLDCYRSSVTMSVTDNGDGIDPKQLNLVLEPLYRIDENIQSGTGLGLHIVRTLVESHGGRGEIRSGSTGTSIAVKLPRATGSRIIGKTAGPPGMLPAI